MCTFYWTSSTRRSCRVSKHCAIYTRRRWAAIPLTKSSYNRYFNSKFKWKLISNDPNSIQIGIAYFGAQPPRANQNTGLFGGLFQLFQELEEGSDSDDGTPVASSSRLHASADLDWTFVSLRYVSALLRITEFPESQNKHQSKFNSNTIYPLKYLLQFLVKGGMIFSETEDIVIQIIKRHARRSLRKKKQIVSWSFSFNFFRASCNFLSIPLFGRIFMWMSDPEGLMTGNFTFNGRRRHWIMFESVLYECFDTREWMFSKQTIECFNSKHFMLRKESIKKCFNQCNIQVFKRENMKQ